MKGGFHTEISYNEIDNKNKYDESDDNQEMKII